MKLNNVILEKKDHIATLTINRPPSNTMNLNTLTDLEKAMDDLEKDLDVRVIILTGAGNKCFCTGFETNDSANATQYETKAQILWQKLDGFEKPIIAAINGNTLEGGMELAMSCHFRIMADNPEAKMGWIKLDPHNMPRWYHPRRLQWIAHEKIGFDTMLLGQPISAEQAKKAGLINDIKSSDQLMEEVREFAANLSQSVHFGLNNS